MQAILMTIVAVLGIYSYILIANVICSWLLQFNVLNPHQPFVRSLLQVINTLTEPVLRPIRNILPNLNGLDLSPLVALLLIYFLRNLIIFDIAPRLA